MAPTAVRPTGMTPAAVVSAVPSAPAYLYGAAAGSGFHRGVRAGDLSAPGRLLAVAEAYQNLVEDRPFRVTLTPAQAAEKMVKASKLKDAAGRNSLAANREAALKSDDPLIALAQAIDAPAQRMRKQHDDIIGTLEVSATEKIAQFRLKLFGAADYPDGTGTPRVEFGIVKGYIDRAGVPQPYAATFSGLYYRKDNEGPWLVPQRWIDARDSLNPVTQLNFVSTADIGGAALDSAVPDAKDLRDAPHPGQRRYKKSREGR